MSRECRREGLQSFSLNVRNQAQLQMSLFTRIHALKHRAKLARDAGRLEDSLSLYQEALASCREHTDSLLLAHTARHVGDVLVDLRRFDDAEPFYREALAKYRMNEKTNLLDLANALRSVAILREREGMAEESRAMWKEARIFYRRMSIAEGIAECDAHLSTGA